jgi:hypothetical protein
VAPTQWTNRPNFYACSDGMFCTENDYCWGGACSQNTGSPCSGSIPSCDETTNQCEQCLTGSDCQTNFPDTPYCINNACYECVWNGDCVPQAPYCYSMWGGGFDNYYYSLGTNGVCQSHSCKYSSVTCGYRHGSEPLSAWCDDPSMGRPATGDGCCTASGTGGTLVCPF